MPLERDWNHRVDNWKNELLNHFYIILGNVDFSGFITKGQMTVREAEEKEFSPMPVGTKWGAKWEYGWFKGCIELP